jgi:AcrR family transcriptional regulator
MIGGSLADHKPMTADSRTHRGPRDERGVIADRILAVARTHFAKRGYAGTSLRAIAREAGVDPTLVTYYYTSKGVLLDAALNPPATWTQRLAEAAAAPIGARGAALVRCLITSWEEDPDSADFLQGAILIAAHEQVALQRLAANFAVHILDAVSRRIDDDERLLRASLVSTQMVGLAITRYVWRVGAVATLPPDKVICLIAPTVQRYLNGKLCT